MKFNIIFIIFFINSLSISAATNANEHKQKIINYIININEFSSKFIQSDGHTIEEGNFYIKKNRLKIVYTYPSRIELIIAKNKAMYFNKDLKEVEYFNPKKTMADIFFRVFNDELFFDKANIELKTEECTA